MGVHVDARCVCACCVWYACDVVCTHVFWGGMGMIELSRAHVCVMISACV